MKGERTEPGQSWGLVRKVRAERQLPSTQITLVLELVQVQILE